MRKLILIGLLGAALALTGCGDVNGDGDGWASLFPSAKGDKGDTGDTGATGLSAYEIWLEQGNEGTAEDFIASLVGADGQSAYQIAVDNGFDGTVEEWLQSLVGPQGPAGEDGADGADGVCPDCNTTDPVDPPVLQEGVVKMTFITKITGLTEVKVGHLIDGNIILIEDANVTEDNGTTYIEYDMSIDSNGTHMIGLQFDK